MTDGVNEADAFELGYRAGQGDLAKQVEKILDGDPLAIAEAVGATPDAELDHAFAVDTDKLLAEIEKHLREQD